MFRSIFLHQSGRAGGGGAGGGGGGGATPPLRGRPGVRLTRFGRVGARLYPSRTNPAPR